MTEEEAKNKWCPMVRVLSDEGSMVIATVNRGSGLQAGVNCIGSKCMWWVWDVEPERARELSGFGAKYQTKPYGHCGAIKCC
jgi:hypothetical protein